MVRLVDVISFCVGGGLTFCIMYYLLLNAP